MLRKEINCDAEESKKVWEEVTKDDIMIGFEPRGKHATAMVMTDGVLFALACALYSQLGGQLPEGCEPMSEGCQKITLKMVAGAMGNALNNYFDAGFGYIKMKEGGNDISDK